MKQKTIKKGLLSIVYLIILISIIKIVIAASFDFNPTPPTLFELNEDEYWSYDVNVTCSESLVNFTITEDSPPGLTINRNTGLMELTPTNDDVGLSTDFNIIAKNESNPADVIITYTIVNVSNVNDAPNITNWQPTNLNVSTYENVSGGAPFSVNITDIDLKHGDSLNISWFFDGNLTKNETNVTTQNNITEVQSTWTFYPGFADAGIRNVSVIVVDSESITDALEWRVNVNNSNRAPVFNKTIQNSTWSEGNNNTNNISLHEHFYDLDYLDGTDNLTFGYIVHNVYNAWDNSTNITIIINQTTGNVSFYTPHPDWFGVGVVQFYVNDSYVITYSNNVTLNITNINDPPILECLDNQTLAIEVLYTTEVNASDIDSTTLYFSDNSTLFNISLNTGIISFTPNSTDIGTYDINISVNDSELSDSCIVVFDITNNTRPVLADINNQTAWESSYFEMNVTASDADLEDNLTFSDDTTMFEIITINSSASNATGIINFTPTNAHVGNNTILITVTDSNGATDSKTFNLEVNNINNAPYFTTVPTQDVRVNFTHILDMTLFTEDADNDPLNFSSNSSIFNITLAGIITVTLNSSYVGTYDVNITVKDIEPKIATTVVTFTVSINQNPQINANFTKTCQEDVQCTLDLGATDPDGDTMTFGDNTTLFDIASDGIIQFTPTQDDVGNYTITINVSDSYNGFNSTILYLEIQEENDPPYFIQVENRTLEEEVAYTIYLLANDIDGSFPLTFNSNRSDMLTITQHNDTAGRIDFTPDDQFVGNHTIRFSVSDGIATVYAIAIYEIHGVNDPPTIIAFSPPANYTIIEGFAQAFNVTASDPDTVTANITHEWYKDGVLQISVSNTTQSNWSFTPGYCDAGDYNITVIVWDLVESDYQTWNITVNNSNRAPAFNTTIPGITWRQPFNRTNNFSLMDYINDPDFECNGSQRDTLTYGASGNVNIDINIDQSSGNVSLYPDPDWFGSETVQFYASDGHNTTYSNAIILNVTENFAPTVDMVYPYGNETFDNVTNTTTIDTIFDWASASLFPNGTRINTSENTSLTFNQQSSDNNSEDNNSLSYSWLLDGVEQITTSSWTFDMGFNDSGIRNVTVLVSDGFKQGSFFWNLTVDDRNIEPVFGKVEHSDYTDFSGGTTNRTNLTVQQGNITLSMQNPTNYYSDGSFISPSIDFNDNTIKPELAYIYWSAHMPNGTNITLQTRVSSDGSSWSNWSNIYTNSTQSAILNFTPSGTPNQIFHDGVWNIWDNRYMQYKVNFYTSNTSIAPVLNGVAIDYEIADFESDEDVTLTDWIDLDDYFYDPDGETLTYGYSGTYLENFDYIYITDGVVSLKPTNDWNGLAAITFSATDANNYTSYSNEVILTITDIPDEETTRTVTVTRTRTRPQPVPVRELAFLELVVPGVVEMGPNETIIAPILLQNKGEVALTGLRLLAVTDEEGIILEFAEDYFGALEAGQTMSTELYISAEGRIRAGTYSITVAGEVEEPEARDTAIITISVLENMTEKVNAVSDFLQLYPECLELNELIVQSQRAVEQGQYNEATSLLDQAVEGCKYLVSTREDVVRPAPKAFKLSVRWITITAGAWILLLLIIHLISVIVRRRAMRHKPV
ncbi:tandem-95 repeat protein [Candidatus Woesearchaeota archaeon]|nr:tandem-95 repeat protein [Candidatus Woesearchaeota archaeon]